VLTTTTVNVDGAGSRLEIADTIGIGSANASANAFLNITNGGAVVSAGGGIGTAFASTATKSVLISGPGSSWTVGGTLDLRNAASVSVLNGGAVSATTSRIGNGLGGTGSLLISGAGSTYSVTGDQQIGVNTGTGIVTLADGGHMTVGGVLTLASAATSTGILNIGGAEGQAATGAGTLDAATLVFGPGTGRVNFNHTDAAYEFSTAMSGGGAVNQTGPGTTILTGNNTYSGLTTIATGTLQIGNGGTTGTLGTGNVVNNGMLAFNRSDDVTYGGAISGTGALTKLGNGTLTLTGNNTYGGPTTIAAGTLQVGNGGTTGTLGGGDVVNNGMLAFNRSDDVTYGGDISGTGALTKLGNNTLTLTGDNSYTGDTTIASGRLELGNGGTSGSVLGDIIDNGVLAFNRSDTLGMPGVISGSGAVEQLGTGTTILIGDNTYTGGTTISAGTLQLGNGGASGSIEGDVTNNGTLAFNRSDTMTFSGIISGTGAIRQIGSGLTRLTGDSSGFTGTTSVEAGTLAVNGSLCGPLNVLAGGTLQGIGTVCDTTNAGIVAPGNSIGTLTVNGDYVGTGGLLEVEAVLGGDTSPTDLLHVTGNTSGTTDVQVINLGGAGAQTNEGIRIVQVDGASDGTFTLLGDYEFEGDQAVVGGAYAYRLYEGSTSAPGDGDWYLRSDLVDGDPDSGPLLQPGVPLYEAYAEVLQSFNKLGTMRQRIGNRQGVIESEDDPVLSGRFYADQSRYSPATSATGVSYDVTSTGLYLGSAGAIADGLVAGLNVRLGGTSTGVDSALGSGSIATTGLSAAGTLTWFAESGFYLDAQAQVSLFGSRLSSSTANRTLVSGNGGSGYGASLEIGQQIALGPNWSLTPQAQLAYSEVRFASFLDTFGAAVSLDNSQSLIGRLGLALDYGIEGSDETGQATSTRIYGTADLYYDFGGGSTATVSGLQLTNSNDPLWAGLGIGGSHSWGDGKYTIHGEALVKTGLANPGANAALGGTIGIRVAW
jgi:fibronectin-binding autotransporter adhesin